MRRSSLQTTRRYPQTPVSPAQVVLCSCSIVHAGLHQVYKRAMPTPVAGRANQAHGDRLNELAMNLGIYVWALCMSLYV